jgi:FkbM family methyltransferase
VVAAGTAAHLASTGRVIACEPSPDTLRPAASTIAVNDASNAVLVNAAVSDTDGSLVLHATPGNSAIASARRHKWELLNEWQEITVPAVRLDTLHAVGETRGCLCAEDRCRGPRDELDRGALEFIAEARLTVVYEYTPVAAAAQGRTQEDSIALLARAGLPVRGARGDRRAGPPGPPPEAYTGQVNVFARPSSCSDHERC